MKEAIVRASHDNPQLRHRVLASADPQAYAEVMAMRDKVPLAQWLRMLERVNIKDQDWRAGYNEDESQIGETSEPLRMVSLAVAGITGIPTVKELIDNIIHGAEEILNKWEFLKTR
jgi:hypothetical protein